MTVENDDCWKQITVENDACWKQMTVENERRNQYRISEIKCCQLRGQKILKLA